MRSGLPPCRPAHESRHGARRAGVPAVCGHLRSVCRRVQPAPGAALPGLRRGLPPLRSGVQKHGAIGGRLYGQGTRCVPLESHETPQRSAAGKRANKRNEGPPHVCSRLIPICCVRRAAVLLRANVSGKQCLPRSQRRHSFFKANRHLGSSTMNPVRRNFTASFRTERAQDRA